MNSYEFKIDQNNVFVMEVLNLLQKNYYDILTAQ